MWRHLIQLLQKINELGTTILFATHDPTVIDLLKEHQHLVLEKGKLLSEKAPQKERKEQKEKKKQTHKKEK